MSQKLFLAFAIVLCIQQVKNPQKMQVKRKTCYSWQAVCRPQQGEAGQPEPESEPEPGNGAGNLLQQVATQWWISLFSVVFDSVNSCLSCDTQAGGFLDKHKGKITSLLGLSDGEAGGEPKAVLTTILEVGLEDFIS